MTPPKHELDDELRAFTAGESWPPEAEDEFVQRRNRALAAAETPTGVHNLQELVRLGQERAVAFEKARFDSERAARLKAEAKLEEIFRERRKFWSTVFAGILIGLTVPASIFVFWKLVH
jgi:hypothetical protein